MNLLIDIGNTSAKLAVMNGEDMVHFERRNQPWADAFRRLTSEYTIDRCAISTVAAEDHELKSALASAPFSTLWLTSATPGMIRNIPKGYGADRLAADIGARTLARSGWLLVIDAGTCITYDLIGEDNQFAGGVISPGAQLRLNAMHEHTALLPQLYIKPDTPVMGANTQEAMMSAATHAITFEIEGYVRHLSSLHPTLHVCITGGNTFSFSPDVSCRITQDSHLVLRGLNYLISAY